MAERNLNHFWMALPEDCRSIHVFMDGELFDEFVAVGLVPLHDERETPKYGVPGYEMPVFIGYEPEADPQHLKGLDILARIRAARSGGSDNNAHSEKTDTPSPSQGPDSGRKSR